MTNSPPVQKPYWRDSQEIYEVVASSKTTAQALRWLAESLELLEHAKKHGDLARCLVEPQDHHLNQKWDTLVAAALRHKLRQMGETAPSWTYKKPLDKFWFPVSARAASIMTAIRLTPPELRRVGIFIPEAAL